jgi:hypothetical protein
VASVFSGLARYDERILYSSHSVILGEMFIFAFRRWKEELCGREEAKRESVVEGLKERRSIKVRWKRKGVCYSYLPIL